MEWVTSKDVHYGKKISFHSKENDPRRVSSSGTFIASKKKISIQKVMTCFRKIGEELKAVH